MEIGDTGKWKNIFYIPILHQCKGKYTLFVFTYQNWKFVNNQSLAPQNANK